MKTVGVLVGLKKSDFVVGKTQYPGTLYVRNTVGR
jgi:hypothetical protein